MKDGAYGFVAPLGFFPIQSDDTNTQGHFARCLSIIQHIKKKQKKQKKYREKHPDEEEIMVSHGNATYPECGPEKQKIE